MIQMVLLVLELMSESGKPLSALVEECIARFPVSGEINREVADAKAVIDKVLAHYKDDVIDVGYTDGVSVSFAEWRFNLRMSNTEPVIRLNVESRGDIKLMKKKTKEILELMGGK